VTTTAERTRGRLQTTALRLFLEHGYDETTVAQVASAAGVSHMTFFRYFPTKESVVVDDPYDPLIAEAVAQQPSALPAFERVRLGLLSAWREMPDLPQGETRDRVLLGLRHPPCGPRWSRATDGPKRPSWRRSSAAVRAITTPSRLLALASAR
jgi:AcrR family transcriptional regulator